MTTARGADPVSTTARTRDATLLVAGAAALWGLDGVLRKPLATALDAGTVVLWEHVIALAVLAPGLPAALRAFARCRWRDRLAVVVIGVGASAVATALFTQSFALAARSHDFVTPLVLQKLQPVFAIALAVVLLRERLRPSYAVFVLPALVGAWLLTFADPLDVRVSELQAALLAVGAAVLWAGGTVLGRLVSTALDPREITTLRFGFGLLGAIGVVQATGAAVAPGWGNLPGLVLLALIPGLFALVVYYRALRSTPASRATLAELAFPATAAVVGVLFLHTHLSGTQWLGLAVVAVAVTLLGWHESRRPAAVVPSARESEPVRG
ncbi:DMT family transporter [Jatrophihabitans endophyticus]|uniref:DMT family transporter n=1 Tax=Jatrophihabitans endophyticus TaxID=1206085 RepID=UPI00190EDDC4|nr:DMT family transporter [Jatrophihabitans endophyticus]